MAALLILWPAARCFLGARLCFRAPCTCDWLMIIDLRLVLDTYLACDCDSTLCTWLLIIVIDSSWLSMFELSISEETLMMPSPR